MESTASPTDTSIENAIVRGDCLEQLAAVPDETVDLAFADPPFNIGFKYDRYQDDHEDEVYIAWCTDWMRQLHRVLKPTGSFWLAIGDEFAADLRVKAHRELGFSPRNWVVWYYTFGQNCRRKFNRSHVHLFHFVKDEEQHKFNAEDPLVRVPSARALVYGDRRANPTGRLPDDTWMLPPAAELPNDWVLRPQDLRENSEAFQAMDDTWYFSRVAGTFKERQGFHGCQMPEQLLGRIVRVSTDPGDLVLDPFAGSGTTLAVAKKLGRRWLGVELSEDYARMASERLEAAGEGDPLNGPLDPVASSPTTAAGRKLKGHPLLPTFEAKDFAQPEPVAKDPPAPKSAGKAKAKAKPASAVSLRDLQQQTLVDAFTAVRDGHSIDWLLCDPALQDAFHDQCRQAGLIGRASDWNRELLKLRKAGKLKAAKTKTKGERAAAELDEAAIDGFAFAAEIAWAELTHKFPGWSLDALFCSPGKAFLFDRTAARYVAESVPPANLRWAALRLRKARKSIAADAKKFHYVVGPRDFDRFNNFGRLRPARLDGQSGVYLIRNRARDAVYLGETLDLARRLRDHSAAKAPGRAAASVAVILSTDLPSDEYRLPLWRSLVARYTPRLNAPVVEASV